MNLMMQYILGCSKHHSYHPKRGILHCKPLSYTQLSGCFSSERQIMINNLIIKKFQYCRTSFVTSCTDKIPSICKIATITALPVPLCNRMKLYILHKSMLQLMAQQDNLQFITPYSHMICNIMVPLREKSCPASRVAK